MVSKSMIKRWIKGTPPRGKWTLARRALQVLILLGFALQLPIYFYIVKPTFHGNVTCSMPLEGSLASSRVFCEIPMFDPWAFIELWGSAHHVILQTVIGVAVVVVLYSFLGRFFCGWVCPMDLLFSIFEKKLSLPKDSYHMKYHEANAKEKVVPIISMAIFFILSVYFSIPFYTTISPIAGTTKFFDELVAIAMGLPGAALGTALAYVTFIIVALVVNIVAEKAFKVKRFWCKYVCPVGNFYGFVMNKYSPFRIKVEDVTKCTKCNLCSMVCPMNIDVYGQYVNTMKDVKDYRCFHCGRCVEVCPSGVLKLGFRFKK